MALTSRCIECVIFLVFVSLASSKFCGLSYTKCSGSTSGTIHSVQINETCASDGEGQLVSGTFVRINFTFSASAPETELTSKVEGKIVGLPFYVPYPINNYNACKNSGLKCPIKANTKYQFLPLLEVKHSFPLVHAVVKWQLQDKKGNDVFCVEMKAHIVKK